MNNTERMRAKRASDPAYVEKERIATRERMRAKRATDPAYVEKQRIANLERSRIKRATDPQYRTRHTALQAAKRANDPEHRAQRNAQARQYHHNKRATDPAYNARYNVRRITINLIRIGLLVQPDECEECKAPGKPDAHHLHYDQRDSPLAIKWLCQSCHAKAHRKYDALTITEE